MKTTTNLKPILNNEVKRIMIKSCHNCTNEHPNNEMYKLPLSGRGYVLVCKDCIKRMDEYTDDVNDVKNIHVNDFTMKRQKTTSVVTTTSTYENKNLNTISQEFEVGKYDDNGNLNDEEKTRFLTSFGYLASYDCTVLVEYKSPIYTSLLGMDKILKNIDKQGITIGSSASTHINVWNQSLGTEDYDLLRKYYDELFYGLYKRVKETSSTHAKLWGRRIDGRDGLGGYDWASGFDNYNHSNFINTESCKRYQPRLEFRLCRYCNNKQFMNLNRMIMEMMTALMTHFFAYKNKGEAKLNQKAIITSGKLVNIYNKYLEKAQNL